MSKSYPSIRIMSMERPENIVNRKRVGLSLSCCRSAQVVVDQLNLFVLFGFIAFTICCKLIV